MKRKRLSKKKQVLGQMLDSSDDENNQSTTVTSEAHSPSASSSTDNPNSNSSTSNIVNLNDTNPDANMSIGTPSLNSNIGGQKLVSKVWLYATKLDDGQQAACQLCDFKCSCNSHSTSTIRQHLISKHNKTDLIIQSTSTSTYKTAISQALKNELHQLCYIAIIKDSRSFSDLNKHGIKTLLNKLCPGYLPPHRNLVARNLKDIYKQHYELLKEELKQVYRLSVTLDFWSNRRAESFLCITGHWTSNSWKSISKVIDFSCFNSRHTAIEIANVIKEKLIALGVYEKVICITCDGAQNMVLACQLLNDDVIRIWCCAHRLHLVVINALGFWIPKDKMNNDLNNALSTNITSNHVTTADINYNINNMDTLDIDWDYDLNEDSRSNDETNFTDETDETNEATSVVNNNTGNDIEYNDEMLMSGDEEQVIDERNIIESIEDNWSKDFEDINPTEEHKKIMGVIAKCRSIAKVTKKSHPISEFIRKEKKLLKLNKSIIIDCKSRWNSTYHLADSLFELKLVIIKLFSEKKNFNLSKEQISKLTAIEFNSEDWDLLSSLCYVLNPFRLATQMMSGKSYPTIGLAYYSIYRVKCFCLKDDNTNEQIRTLKILLLDKLNKYFYHDHEQMKILQRYAYFDPAAHLCFTDREKYQIEIYIKQLIMDEVYPMNLPTTDSLTTPCSTTASSSGSSITTARPQQQQLSTPVRSKLSIHEQFMLACGEEEVILTGTAKEKSKRVSINDEIKRYKIAVQQFNIKAEPSGTSALQFWQTHHDQFPLLSNLAKIHLATCATSVPSESAFSLSSYIARKERARLSGENLCYSVFLKDKV